MSFNELLFDAELVRINFSSNCTESMTVDYSTPFIFVIPDTGNITGFCQFVIQLVDRNLTAPIGNPVVGLFSVDSEYAIEVDDFMDL